MFYSFFYPASLPSPPLPAPTPPPPNLYLPVPHHWVAIPGVGASWDRWLPASTPPPGSHARLPPTTDRLRRALYTPGVTVTTTQDEAASTAAATAGRGAEAPDHWHVHPVAVGRVVCFLRLTPLFYASCHVECVEMGLHKYI